MIDLRSDTVTRPSDAMRALMATAEVGDDVWGDDPTVIQLEELAAQMMGKESAMFVASGTQSNLCAILAHCQRGDEYIVGQSAHTYKYEAGGAAVLGSVQPQPLDFDPDGTLPLDKVRAAIKPDDSHFARSRLLCLENTTDGKPLPVEYVPQAKALADEFGLGFHLDGARAANAAVAHGISLKDVAEPFDSISLCLSKGLGAPVGSVLAASSELIASARRWRKMLGGGMRQAGVIAAAGIYALENNIDRLSQDHANAELLAKTLEENGVQVNAVQTNMVFANFGSHKPTLQKDLADRGALLAISDSGSSRMVTHQDVSPGHIHSFGSLLGELL